MTLSRRRLLHLSLLTIGTSALSVSTGHRFPASATGVTGTKPLDVAHVPLNAFESVKNSTFTVKRPGHKSLHLTLSEVSELERTDSTEGFSLRLKGRLNEDILEQGTYHLSHPKLGEMDLFMVPGKSDRLGRTYGVVINRLIS